MKLDTEFYKLPLRFDAERLREEAAQFSEDEWREHPQAFAGNTAMILVAAHGGINDELHGPMRPTPKLARCPYIRQVMAAFDTVIGRSRLMRVTAQGNVPGHCDINYYWANRVRIHVPIVTDPSVRFVCGQRSVHMAAGEAWVFDTWRRHSVENPSPVTRIHLVIDTCGSAAFWDLLARAQRPFAPDGGAGDPPRAVAWNPDVEARFATETFNAPVVMHPGELELLLGDLRADLLASDAADTDERAAFLRIMDAFLRDWRAAWSQYGERPAGWPRYRELRRRVLAETEPYAERLPIAGNAMPARSVLRSRVEAALNPELAAAPGSRRTRPAAAPRFERPVFIVAAPRSGSTMLYEALARNRALWSLGGEAHAEIEGIPALDPARNGFHSNRLGAAEATPAVRAALRAAFLQRLRDADGRRYLELPAGEQPAAVRFLEKTPKNALRIPFLRALWPDARFIWLYRNPRDNLSSIIDAWRSGRFVTYPRLPEWPGPPWSLLLAPGWRALAGAPIERIAAFQWLSANQTIADDLAELPEDHWAAVSYEALLADAAAELERLCAFIDVPFGPRMRAHANGPLPLSRHTLAPPEPDKWLRNEREVLAVLPELEAPWAEIRRAAGGGGA